MKKFTKVSLITAVVIMFLGIIIYVIGFLGGGQNDVNRMVENGELSYFDGHFQINPYFKDGGFFSVGWWDDNDSHTFGFSSGDDIPEAPKAPDAPEAPEKPSESEKVTTSAIMEGTDEAVLTADDLEELVIELGGGEFIIEAGDVDNIQITTDCKEKFKGYIENKTLYIEGFDVEGNYLKVTEWDDNRNSAHIVIPKELAFKTTEISLGAGRIEITDLTLGNTEAEVGAGELKCTNTKSNKLEAELGAGAVYMENIEAGESNITVAMGEAVLSGIFSGNMDLECSMGNLDVEIEGKEEEFNYSVEAALGTAEIAGESYEGLATERKVDNGADKTINAEVSMGDIEISFTK